MPLIIFHFRNIQFYPPLLNLIKYLEDNQQEYILITSNKKTDFRWNGLTKLMLYASYISFIIRGFIKLMANKNVPIIYFESISCAPVYYYFRLFKKRELYIHFHEYFSIEEYKKQSLLERIGRRFEEKLLFYVATWISHTNKDRINLLEKEYPRINKSILKIMPNYPSESWLNNHANFVPSNSITTRILHIGALSYEGTHLKSTLEFFGNKENINIDFFSHSKNQEIISEINSYPNCKFCGSISYNEIPNLSQKYDVGLVLYNGTSLNFTYNSPNKIFEYLALNLDVWCSTKLITAHKLKREHVFPKIILVDFDKLSDFNIEEKLNKKGLAYEVTPYTCEKVYEKLLKKVNNLD